MNKLIKSHLVIVLILSFAPTMGFSNFNCSSRQTIDSIYNRAVRLQNQVDARASDFRNNPSRYASYDTQAIRDCFGWFDGGSTGRCSNNNAEWRTLFPADEYDQVISQLRGYCNSCGNCPSISSMNSVRNQHGFRGMIEVLRRQVTAEVILHSNPESERVLPAGLPADEAPPASTREISI